MKQSNAVFLVSLSVLALSHLGGADPGDGSHHVPLFAPPINPHNLVSEVHHNGGHLPGWPGDYGHEEPSNSGSSSQPEIAPEDVYIVETENNPEMLITFLSEKEKNASFSLKNTLSQADRGQLEEFFGRAPLVLTHANQNKASALAVATAQSIEHDSILPVTLVQIPFKTASELLTELANDLLGPEEFLKNADFIKENLALLKSRKDNLYFSMRDSKRTAETSCGEFYSILIMDPLEGSAFVVDIGCAPESP